MSQVEIAIKLGINKSSFCSWESGRAKPNQKNLAALAKILDVDVSYFESEHNIVNNFLQLTTANQQKAEEQLEYDIAAWISGKSMEPIYQDGEVALIRSSGFDYDGAVYALSWNDSVFIKKLYRLKEGFRMVSLNDKYPDKVYSL